MLRNTESISTGNASGESPTDCAELLPPPSSGQMTLAGQGVGVGCAPGSDVPPPDWPKDASEAAPTSAAVTSSFLNTGSPPIREDGRARERSAAHCTPAQAGALSPEREAFRQLFNAGHLPEARRLAGAMCEAGKERVAWVNNLANVAREQGALREAYSLYLTNAHLLDSCRDVEAAAKYNLTFGMVSQALWIQHGMREYALRAEKAYRDAAKLYDRAGRTPKVACALNNLGWLCVSVGEPRRAHPYLDIAHLLFYFAGELARCADVEDTRALALEAEGKLAEALECSTRAVVALFQFGEAERKSFDAACETHARIFEKVKAGL